MKTPMNWMKAVDGLVEEGRRSCPSDPGARVGECLTGPRSGGRSRAFAMSPNPHRYRRLHRKAALQRRRITKRAHHLRSGGTAVISWRHVYHGWRRVAGGGIGRAGLGQGGAF